MTKKNGMTLRVIPFQPVEKVQRKLGFFVCKR